MSLLIVLSVKTLNNLTNLAAVEAPQELRLDGGDLTALYTLNAGMNKPAILNRAGDVLVEFSGWNSYVTVDGVTVDLWSHVFNIELDRERARAFHTWTSAPLRQGDPQGHRIRRYQIQQVVSLLPNHATVEYFIIPNEPVTQVQLTLGLYKWYYQALTRSADQFVFSSSDLTRQQAEQGFKARRFTAVAIRSMTQPHSATVLSDDVGNYAVQIAYRISSPNVYGRTLLARLQLTLRDEALPNR